MSDAAIRSAPVATRSMQPVLTTSRIGDGALWLAAFLSGFVIREPAPYELYLALITVIWLLFGLKLRSEFGPLVVCFLLYCAGGIASVPLATKFETAFTYTAVTVFLTVTSIFYAAVLAEKPGRFKFIEHGYLACSVIVAITGILGYFHAFPGAEFFTRYDRARGTFEDPNVYGPFLALPTVILVQRLMVRPLRECLLLLPILGILVLGIFLSFSRGAWGVLLAASLVVYALGLITEQNSAKRLRLVLLGLGGVLALAAMLAVALSFDSVWDMFQQRAKLEQPYDVARLGRFARYSLGFEMVLERPLGLGALEFNQYFPEDEHNVYLKGFTTYGWLGGTAYIVFLVWTFARLVPLLFKHRPWTPFIHCIFGVMLAHMFLQIIIDTDHWRHVYMLYGLAWGLIAAERILQKQSLSAIPLQRQRPASPRCHSPVDQGA
ncbi:O-antigen ligase family protein [Roseibium sp.]|uniref:O-antigen ligase family protein n=1 Tax=Roseibium sp. TaxID=1936156 RepID=UPI003A98126E